MFRGIIDKFLKSEDTHIVSVFFFLYALIFSPRIHGAGQYWDMVFPYFKSQMSNFFWSSGYAWNGTFGYPLQYSSDFYFRFIVSQFNFIQPELVLYLLYVSLFAFGSYGVLLLIDKEKGLFVRVVAALSAFLNPALFSITLAGYVNDVVSYVILIYLLLFLKNYFNASFKHYLILALFFSFIGVSLQFFILSAIVVGIYFLFNIDKLKIKFVPLLILIPILLNLPWLSNIISGSTSIKEISQHAVAGQNLARSKASLINIFNFSFSSVTLLKRYFSDIYFIYFTFLSATIFMTLCFLNKNKYSMFLVANMTFFIFFATGMYRNYELWPLSILYPMFREVMHTLPVLFIFFILVFANGKSYLIRMVTSFAMLPMLFIIVYFNMTYSNAVNFSEMRSGFSEFEAFIRNSPEIKNHRVMTYPFFGTYGINGVESKEKGTFRMNNAGYDSFMHYAGLSTIDNAMPPTKVHDSIQYSLLKNNKLDPLKKRSVRYIFDFSGIYTSYYDRYVGTDAYDGDISLIKNNPNLMSNISNENPGSFRRIGQNIYEIVDPLPLVYTASASNCEGIFEPTLENKDVLKLEYEKLNPTRIRVKVQNPEGNFCLVFSENYNPGWRIHQNIESSFTSKFTSILDKYFILDKTHKYNPNFVNTWIISEDDYCDETSPQKCKLSVSENVLLLDIEFVSQHSMNFNYLISGVTFLLLGILILVL